MEISTRQGAVASLINLFLLRSAFANCTWPAFSLATSHWSPGSIRQTTQGISNMGKKLVVITLAVFAFLFGSTPRLNAGTETVEPYRAPARTYNYGPPPPRPVVYGPPVSIGFAIGPAWGFYGPRFGFFPGRRFFRPHAHWHGHPHHWH